MLGLTLTDPELTAWLVDLRHDAASASMAAAKATGDEQTLGHLAARADVKRRRAEWLNANIPEPAPYSSGAATRLTADPAYQGD